MVQTVAIFRVLVCKSRAQFAVMLLRSGKYAVQTPVVSTLIAGGESAFEAAHGGGRRVACVFGRLPECEEAGGLSRALSALRAGP